MTHWMFLFALLSGAATGMARPLPQSAWSYDAVTLNRATKQLTMLRARPRPDESNFAVTLTLTTPSISFAVNSANAYNAGVTLLNHNTLSVADNVGTGTYVLSVRANSANLTSGAQTIPVSQVDVQIVRINAAAVTGTRRTLSTTSQTLISYPYTGAAFTGQQLFLNYWLKPGAALLRPAGNYTTTLTFTITGP